VTIPPSRSQDGAPGAADWDSTVVSPNVSVPETDVPQCSMKEEKH